jgi:acetylornithine deacetylase/succinyl-diaminopimelate desuccinylase-like protein
VEVAVVLDSVLAYLTQHREEHVEWLKALCRIPSISTKAERRADIVAAAHWTRDLCAQIGLTATVHETPGHPLVFAEWNAAENTHTILVYGHVDVQPEGQVELWDHGPFEPTVRDGWLYARGAADNKGPLLAHLRAAAAWLATHGRLPINIKFLIEAEEEISSPNLAAFVRQQRHLLRCDDVVISDTALYADGWPTITRGTRGIVYKELRLGGPRQDLHSGSFGGTVANPASVLAAFIAGLHDAYGRVTIPGFYDDVQAPADDERAQLAALPFDEQAYARQLGVPALWGESGYSTTERRTVRPALDVNGIYGGFMAEGANTIIPAQAGAKLSMRLVPGQDAARVSAAFDACVRERIPPTVRAEIIHHGMCDAYLAPGDSPAMQAARRALVESFGRDVALLREGGSLPILPMFQQVLGADSLLIGLASPQCNAHGPNEKVLLADLDRGAAALARLYAYLG